MRPLWQPQPFKQQRPSWCDSYPALAQELLALDRESYAELFNQDEHLWMRLSRHHHAFASLETMTRLSAHEQRAMIADSRLDWQVPGRKWQQINALARSIDRPGAPLVEWCGGKGHLGRLLAVESGQSVSTLERDTDLCDEGRRLARRAGARQRFYPLDVLGPVTPTLSGQHVVALHACGELHRQLVRKSVEEGAMSLDIAPCCYHLGSAETYQPFSDAARLSLTREDLRLAVTANATASARELRLRDREMAWKLGYIALRNTVLGSDEYRNIKPITKAWLKLGFKGFCQQIAAREGVDLPEHADWMRYEEFGWQRQREVMRLSLVRHAVRRALELWLVLDLALYLQAHAYEIDLATFCDPELSPRNILLSARRMIDNHV